MWTTIRRTAAFPDTGFQPPTEFPEWNPVEQELPFSQGIPPSQLNVNQQHAPAWPVDAYQKLRDAGFWQCPTQDSGRKTRGIAQPCNYWVSPQAAEAARSHNGYITCPRCKKSYDMMAAGEMPQSFEAGGKTHVNISLSDQGQVAENIIAKMKEIPGYGPIVWWHPGGSGSQSPLDGATADWGIEVKSLSYDARNHRFAPGGERGDYNKEDKNNAAQFLGLKGVLGVLVMLDYRRDLADIYVKEMPLEPWETSKGKWVRGVAQFRKDTAQKLVAEVPFNNPFKDPNHPAPDGDYPYARPPVINPEGADLTPHEEMQPFGPVQPEQIPF